MRKFPPGLFIAVFVTFTWAVVLPAFAAPMLDVQFSTNGSGLFTYVITNATPTTEPAFYLQEFTLPFGRNDGVHHASRQYATYGYVISDDNTYFSTPAVGMPPGSSITVTLSSSYFDTRDDLLTARGLSLVGGSWIDFPAVNVSGPAVPEPASSVIMVLGAAGMLLRPRRLSHG